MLLLFKNAKRSDRMEICRKKTKEDVKIKGLSVYWQKKNETQLLESNDKNQSVESRLLNKTFELVAEWDLKTASEIFGEGRDTLLNFYEWGILLIL